MRLRCSVLLTLYTFQRSQNGAKYNNQNGSSSYFHRGEVAIIRAKIERLEKRPEGMHRWWYSESNGREKEV